MGFIVEVGTPVNIGDSRIGYGAPTSEYWDYFINPNNVSNANVVLSILEAVVKIEDITAEWKFGTFTLSSLGDYPTWVLTNSTGWTTNTTTDAQKIAVTGASLSIAVGEYIGLIIHANDSEYTYIAYTGSGTDSYVDTKKASYITTGTAIKKVIGAIDVYGKYEYNHSNSDPIPHTSQSTGEVDKGDVYIGYGAIQLTDIQCTGTYKALFNLQTPWGDTHNSNILAVGESVTKSRAITGGTEYYKITVSNIDCINGDVTFTEQWWSDDGNRYVKTSGSDSALGTTWDVAWKTAGYGFQNIPSGKDLYVEEGLYSSETLSNLDPSQTMSMYIQPVGHTEAPCKIFITDEIPPTITGGLVCADNTPTAIMSATWTFLMTGHTVDISGFITDWCIRQGAVGSTSSVKLKIFRDNGTEYEFIGESDPITSYSGSINTGTCTIHVKSGDMIGVKCTVGVRSGIVTDVSSTMKYLTGDITENTNKSSWSTSSYDAFVVHGYHTA